MGILYIKYWVTENLLLDENGHLKVTDLGISLEKDGGNCCGTSGTRPYMAPEIFLSGHEHSAGVDFYALGVTTHQLLTGHRPYKPTKDLLRKMVRISTMHPDSKLDLRTARAQLVGWQDRKLQNENYNINRRMEHLSKSARDFIRQCLLCNPHYRLGARGIHEVVTHPWFNNVNWKALRDRKARPPFVPVIPSRPADILGRYKGKLDNIVLRSSNKSNILFHCYRTHRRSSTYCPMGSATLSRVFL